MLRSERQHKSQVMGKCQPLILLVLVFLAGVLAVATFSRTLPGSRSDSETLRHRFEREYKPVQNIVASEVDLDKDGKPELAVAFRDPNSEAATIGLLVTSRPLVLVKTQEVELADDLEPMAVLDHQTQPIL